MIRCLLIHISRNQRGQAIRQEHWVEGERLDIGRAAECNIHLPDHRVSLHHAAIHHSNDGRLYIDGENSPLSIDGTFEQSAELTPGMRFLVGPYELVAESILNGEELTLSYELIHPLPESGAHPGGRAPMTLKGAGLSKRKITFWFASLIAVVFLILPISYALSPKLHKALEHMPITPDEPWNAGNMSPGHRALTAKCNTCHQRPFTAVENAACENCHKKTPNHIADLSLHKKIFKDVRCSECHLDHRGRAGLVRHDSQQCVVCHGGIKAKHDISKLANIHDFSSDHPAFRLTIRTGPDEQDIDRIRQTDKAHLVEISGLKYSHEVHFDKALIELPTGKTRDIQCDDCHKPDDAGRGYQPMTMAKTCQQSKCHALNFDPPVAGRHVPHASVMTVMTTLREYFASKTLNSIPAGDTVIENVRGLRRRAETEAISNAMILFTKEEEGTCLECHEVSRDENNKEVPWAIAPVRVIGNWLPKAKFPHDKHQTSKCTDCHDVMHSDKSRDVAIPSIKKCRECHVGSKQVKTQVSSTCDKCHNFHGVADQHPSRKTDPAME